jgi:hypothetical protein
MSYFKVTTNMNNKEIVLGIVAVLMIIVCGAYAYTMFMTTPSPVANTVDTPVAEDVANGNVPAAPTEIIVPPDTSGTNDTGMGLFASDEFSFEYPIQYGSLSMKKTLQPGTPNDPEFAISSFVSSENPAAFLPVSVQGNSYDSGTDTAKKPLCPMFKAEYGCAESVNANGAMYYKIEREDMGGTQVRYEFPLASKTSLVFGYYVNDGTDVQALEKMVASVKIAR